MIEDLVARAQLTESDGAKCIFVPKRKVPLMVQKSDGGYGYDTTDLAALRFRANEEKATWIIYVTDEGQKLHFDTVIDAGKQVGYMDPAVTRYDHVGFGLVLQVMGDGAATSTEESKDGGAKKAAPGKKPAEAEE
jgi:arginyl-tRNA synthetase